MHGVYTLGKPIVAVPVGASGTTILPSGASVEVQRTAQTVLVQVIWQHRSFMVHLPDLLDVCRVEDVGEIAWPEGFGSTSLLSRNDTGWKLQVCLGSGHGGFVNPTDLSQHLVSAGTEGNGRGLLSFFSLDYSSVPKSPNVIVGLPMGLLVLLMLLLIAALWYFFYRLSGG